jgi:type II secretory pathway component PulK
MVTRHQRPAGRKREGVVLLAVLVIVVVLTLAAYQLSEMMMAEYRAADSYKRSVQARALADSGVAYTAALLANPEAFQSTLGGNPYDNPGAFQGLLVHQSEFARHRGRFSVIAPPDMDAGQTAFRYGVTDECGKLNINALLKLDSSGNQAMRLLMNLPNMTEESANSILDWVDGDDETRSNGAESAYYTAQDTSAYQCKNGPLDTLEELLLVKGVTPALLFGNDRNRNGILDPDEDDGSGAVDQGWSAYLTVFSREQNVDSTGQPRIFINDQDLNALYEKLNPKVGPDLATFIVAYRQYGPTQVNNSSSGSGSGQPGQSGASGQQGQGGTSNPQGQSGTSTPQGQSSGSSQQSSSSSTGVMAQSGQRLQRSQVTTAGGFSVSAGGGAGGGGGGGGGGSSRPRAIASLFELVNAYVSIPGQGENAQATIYPSPLNDTGQQRELLPLLLDYCTTVRDAELPARVNINTAPAAVLDSLPGMQEGDAQVILQKRPAPGSAPDPIYQTPAWLVTEAGFQPQQMRTLERYITARSQVYRVQVLGYFEGGGPSVRVEAVIDTNAGRPRVSYWRDLTELGRGFEQ